jgi:hypothetical protein
VARPDCRPGARGRRPRAAPSCPAARPRARPAPRRGCQVPPRSSCCMPEGRRARCRRSRSGCPQTRRGRAARRRASRGRPGRQRPRPRRVWRCRPGESHCPADAARRGRGRALVLAGHVPAAWGESVGGRGDPIGGCGDGGAWRRGKCRRWRAILPLWFRQARRSTPSAESGLAHARNAGHCLPILSARLLEPPASPRPLSGGPATRQSGSLAVGPPTHQRPTGREARCATAAERRPASISPPPAELQRRHAAAEGCPGAARGAGAAAAPSPAAACAACLSVRLHPAVRDAQMDPSARLQGGARVPNACAPPFLVAARHPLPRLLVPGAAAGAPSTWGDRRWACHHSTACQAPTQLNSSHPACLPSGWRASRAWECKQQQQQRSPTPQPPFVGQRAEPATRVAIPTLPRHPAISRSPARRASDRV